MEFRIYLPQGTLVWAGGEWFATPLNEGVARPIFHLGPFDTKQKALDALCTE